MSSISGIPKRKVKRSDKSVLGQAQSSHVKQEPSKLQHITTQRTKGPGGRARKPPSRKPMVERTTKLTTKTISEDVSLVASKKEPPKTLAVGAEDRPTYATRDKEIRKIEQDKRKSMVQNIGQKAVMRIFLDNNGIGFKTVQITPDCNMYELVEIMRKKIFTDTSGFGIWEVRDKLDVQLISPSETVQEITKFWEDTKSYKFVFKKAHGEKAKLYYKPPSTAVKKTNSFGGSLGLAPKPNLSSPYQSNPLPESVIKAELRNSAPTAKRAAPVAKRPPPGMSQELRSSTDSIAQEIQNRLKSQKASSSPTLSTAEENKPIRRIPPNLPQNDTPSNSGQDKDPQRRLAPSNRGNMPNGRGRPVRGRGSPGARRVAPASPSSLRRNQQAPIKQETKEPEVKPPPVEKIVEEPTPTPEVKEPEPEESTTKHITEWSIEEVGAWIETLGFGAVKSIFVDNYISGKELVDLTNDELKEDLGVRALGARKGILREIGKLNV